mgnify:CR=1 FL=1
MKKLYLILLLGIIFVQLAVPFKMMYDRERVLKNGTRFSFKTRPIDPADPFQGRFVRLQLKDSHCTIPEDRTEDFRRKQKMYATIRVHEDGYAHFTAAGKEVPDSPHFLKTRTRGGFSKLDDAQYNVRIQIPFDRFYMEEGKAPRAEKLAIDAARKGDCWVDVRILNGRAVIEDVYVEGESIRALSRVAQ